MSIPVHEPFAAAHLRVWMAEFGINTLDFLPKENNAVGPTAGAVSSWESLSQALNHAVCQPLHVVAPRTKGLLTAHAQPASEHEPVQATGFST